MKRGNRGYTKRWRDGERATDDIVVDSMFRLNKLIEYN